METLHSDWHGVCETSDLVAHSGICALVEGQQVALFYLPGQEQEIYAIGNFDPAGWANVLSRGIVGDLQGQIVVASPLYKHHYVLENGQCLEKPELRVPVYAARIQDGRVLVRV